MAKGSTSWFYKGKAGIERSKQVDAEQKARRDQKGPMRFWLENETSAKITFLDSPEFFLPEHNLKLGGKYFNFYTCLGEKDTCPACEDGSNPSFVVVGSIINHRPWTDRDGNEHKLQKMLFVAKGKARERIVNQIKKRDGGLKWCVYEATRGSSQTECSTGEEFEYLGRLSKEKVKKLIPDGEDKDFLEPFDYEKIFAPKDAGELRKILGMEAPMGSSDSSDDPEPDDPEPDADVQSDDDDDLSIDDLI